jgi:hypothetical protein
LFLEPACNCAFGDLLTVAEPQQQDHVIERVSLPSPSAVRTLCSPKALPPDNGRFVPIKQTEVILGSAGEGFHNASCILWIVKQQHRRNETQTTRTEIANSICEGLAGRIKAMPGLERYVRQ